MNRLLSSLAMFLLSAPMLSSQEEHMVRTQIAGVPGPVAITCGWSQDRNASILKIRVAHKEFRFHAKGSLSELPADHKDELTLGLPRTIPGLQMDKSHCFYRVGNEFKTRPGSMLFFLGNGSDPNSASLLVIGFQSGMPHEVLNLDNFNLIRVNGGTDVIGKETLSEVIAGPSYDPSHDPYATTYDPVAVYVIGPEGKAAYSLTRSRKYNIANYVWAGPKSSENFMVLYNIPHRTKPFLVRAGDVEKYLQPANRKQ